MRLIEKIKSVFKNDTAIETERFVIAQKSCPHCTSRGLLIFDSKLKSKSDNTNEKNS